MRRVRPVIEGTVFKWSDYKFMPSFDSGTAALQDAYFDITYMRPWVSFRGGKDKVPLSEFGDGLHDHGDVLLFQFQIQY